MAELDLLIRGGTVADGTGAPLRTADVAVRDGRIVAVGRVEGSAATVLDASGALVTPGFVDVHTHYDGQVTWEAQVVPSAWHGVTTVVTGNCGVGFAPVQPDAHQRLVELMEGVEDIPGTALHEGLRWDWETFPQFLDAVERRPHDIDVAIQVPHGALRLYVMGERGANREPATADEIATMGALVVDAVRAGALGFTTSRTTNHRTSRGEPTPTLTAAADELVGIASAMGRTGAGVLQVVSDFPDPVAEFTMLRSMIEASGRPLSISMAAEPHRPNWRALMQRIAETSDAGLPMRGQVAVRPIGVLLGLQASLNPFAFHRTYQEIAQRPLAERLAIMRDEAFRQRLLDEHPGIDGRRAGFVNEFTRMFELGDPPDYEPPAEASIAARAEREHRRPEEVLYDLLLADDGRTLLYFPLFNYAFGNLDDVRDMLTHPASIPGLSDGGAHVGTICDASFPTTLITLWTRDRTRGERLDLAWAVRRQTQDTAAAVGLSDRGVLAAGMKADINVIDYDALRLRPPRIAYDLPAGGKRLLQRAEGYRHTFVSGVEIYRDGEATGETPGRLVRGARPAPAA